MAENDYGDITDKLEAATRALQEHYMAIGNLHAEITALQFELQMSLIEREE